MQIADDLTARVVGRELHRADAGALLAFHLTGTRHVDVRDVYGIASVPYSMFTDTS